MERRARLAHDVELLISSTRSLTHDLRAVFGVIINEVAYAQGSGDLDSLSRIDAKCHEGVSLLFLIESFLSLARARDREAVAAFVAQGLAECHAAAAVTGRSSLEGALSWVVSTPVVINRVSQVGSLIEIRLPPVVALLDALPVLRLGDWRFSSLQERLTLRWDVAA